MLTDGVAKSLAIFSLLHLRNLKKVYLILNDIFTHHTLTILKI